MKRLGFIMLWPLGVIQCYIMAVVAMWVLKEVGNQHATQEIFSVSFVFIFYAWVYMNYQLHKQEYVKKWTSVWSVMWIVSLPFWPIVIPTAALCVVGGFIGLWIWTLLEFGPNDLARLLGKLVRYVRYGDPNGLPM